MKRILIILSLSLIIVSTVWGQSRCLTPMFEQARLDLYKAFGGSKGPSTGQLDITLHEVGDTMTFWAFNLSVMPPLWQQIPATCRAVTEYSYIFVADDQWNLNMDSTDVALVAYYWEEGTYIDSTMGIYQLNTENFGMPPDELDDDDHIYIFYSELGSYQGTVFDGYFSVFNEYTEEEAQQMDAHSNEVEMFYMSCNPGNPTSLIRISVLAHEFEHMIHWAADPNEETWVDEGCAEYAMLLFGVPDPLVNFPNNPDNDLTQWNNEFADYIKTFMFFTYLSDHYGGAEIIRTVVQEPLNSVYGVQAALASMGYSESFEEVFVDWVTANFYHGRGGADLSEPDSQYIYYSIDPPAFHISGLHNNYPTGPNSRNVNHWAADYIIFNNPDNAFNRLSVSFSGNSGLEFGTGFVDVFTSGNMDVSNEYPDLGGWQNVIDYFDDLDYRALMVCGPGSVGNFNYSYSADVETGIDDISLPDPQLSLGPLYPNPFNQSIQVKFSTLSDHDAAIEIFDISGRLVKQYNIPGSVNSGEIVWDGKNSDGENVVSGIYLFKLTDDMDSKIVKATLLK